MRTSEFLDLLKIISDARKNLCIHKINEQDERVIIAGLTYLYCEMRKGRIPEDLENFYLERFTEESQPQEMLAKDLSESSEELTTALIKEMLALTYPGAFGVEISRHVHSLEAIRDSVDMQGGLQEDLEKAIAFLRGLVESEMREC